MSARHSNHVPRHRPRPTLINHLVTYIVREHPDTDVPLTRVKIRLLAYLIDSAYYQEHERSFTGARYVLYASGPHATPVVDAIDELANDDYLYREHVDLGNSHTHNYVHVPTDERDLTSLNDDVQEITDTILEEHASTNATELMSRIRGFDRVRHTEKYTPVPLA